MLKPENTRFVMQSLGLHLVFGIVLVLSFKFTPEFEKPKKAPEISAIDAVVIDAATLEKQVNKIKQDKLAAKKKEEARIKELERRAEQAKKDLEKINKQQEASKKAAEKAKRQAAAEKKKAAEQKKKADAEKKKAAEAKRKADAQKKKLAAEKAKAEKAKQERIKREQEAAQAKAAAEEAKKQKEAEQKAAKLAAEKAAAERKKREEEARIAAEKAKAEKERREREAQERALQEKMMQEQLMREQSVRQKARQKVVMSEVEKYTVLITSKIKQNWLTDPSMKGTSCRLNVNIAPSGLVIKVTILSGPNNVCKSAERAVLKAETLPVSKEQDVYNELRDINLTMEPDY